jgi:hypothetical protein
MICVSVPKIQIEILKLDFLHLLNVKASQI